MRAMATRPKHRPTVQHQRNGVKGNPSHCTEACDADRVERPGSDLPKATTEHHDDRVSDRTAPRASPHTTVHRAQRPWHCTQACDVDRQPHACCDPPTATTTQSRCGEDDQTAPMAPPHTTVHQAQRPWRCTQARDVDRQPHTCCDQPMAMTPCCHHHDRHRGCLGHTTPPPSARNSPSVMQKSAVLASWGRATTNRRQRRRRTTTMTAMHATCKGPQQRPLHHPINRPMAQAPRQRTDANRARHAHRARQRQQCTMARRCRRMQWDGKGVQPHFESQKCCV